MRPFRPVAGSVALLGVWWLVAHNGGSGWVQLIGNGLAATVVVGLLGPAVSLRRARIIVVSSPSDAVARTAVEVVVSASSRVRLHPVGPPGPETFLGPARRKDAGDGVLVVVPGRRGVVTDVAIEVATAAPFAFLWWRRRLTLPLARPLVVAPRLGRPVSAMVERADDNPGDYRGLVRSQVGEPRVVRDYQPGDSRRLLHWPVTAHTGRLMVRETEAPAAEPVTVSVSLPQDPEAAERLAESALGTVVALLEDGAAVMLATTETSGAVVALVEDRHQAGRQLARAVAGAAGDPPGITLS